ncbi:acyclic terpene utilization AtuA family protein [uncultured Enterovirga sp.]|uniref:acyclic terpene utilization AtuA family protein n=1 Tax=uncultured Enterovirga sp. TaxID=2026352 RepID=UPI0035CC3AE0
MIRIGCGAGFSADRLGPACDLIEHGRLDVIIFECVGERTLAFGHRDRLANPGKGYNAQLESRMRRILPLCRRHGTKLVTNMGAANPKAAAEATLRIARELGLTGLKVAYVIGDEVTDQLSPDTPLWEGGTVADVGLKLVGANAYIGSDALLPAIQAGADVVIAGRVSDPALVVAPLRNHYGWAEDDWTRLGAGTLAGHLLECGMQITGGYFADPGRKDVPRLAECGFPIAEIDPDGGVVITKLAHAGGCVTPMTVKEQLLYEVHDPARYLTPDVTADFSRVGIEEVGPDRVRLSGGSGRERPPELKVTVGFDGGYLAEGGISYAGPNAGARARLARDVLEERMAETLGNDAKLRLDLIGISSLHGTATEYPSDAQDVRVRAALRSTDRDKAETLLWEVESLLCCGPAGGGGYRGAITPSVVTYSASIARDRVPTRFEMEAA